MLLNQRPIVVAILLACPAVTAVFAQPLVKGQVANLIVKVENGVDQFRDFSEHRAESGRNAAETPKAQGRRGKATESQKSAANAKKDELDDALDDINKSTNRLRRKFDGTDKWIETKNEVQRVVDDGRRINQVLTRGNYGADAARLWGVLRTGINDLARAYNIPPLGI